MAASTSAGRAPALYTPKHWPVWFGFAVLRLLCLLPLRAQLGIGAALGGVAMRFAGRRRHIAATNLALCFPDLDDDARRRLLRRHFAALGMSLFETGEGWWTSNAHIQKRVEIRGREHLSAARNLGRGVIMLSAHFTPMELVGRAMAAAVPVQVLYREHENPVVERVLRRNREGHFEKAIPRDDMRGLLRALKANGVVWFAPDQNYGHKHGVFAPFFGVSAATNNAAARLAKSSGAAVVPSLYRRLPGQARYVIDIYPALADFPSGDPEADTARINRLLEDYIRKAPEQYWWVHRRFKDRPAGERDVYDPSVVW